MPNPVVRKIQMRKLTTDSWVDIPQPDTGLGYSFETTYTASSGRISQGVMKSKAMFTVQQLQYKRTGLTTAELSTILQIIIGGAFQMHFFSPYYNSWMDAYFNVGKGDYEIGQIDTATGLVDSLMFNATGVSPIWTANVSEEEASS